MNAKGLFAPAATVIACQEFTREHALLLQAYSRFHEPFLVAGFVASAAKVNEAVQWWNRVVIEGSTP